MKKYQKVNHNLPGGKKWPEMYGVHSTLVLFHTYFITRNIFTFFTFMFLRFFPSVCQHIVTCKCLYFPFKVLCLCFISNARGFHSIIALFIHKTFIYNANRLLLYLYILPLVICLHYYDVFLLNFEFEGFFSECFNIFHENTPPNNSGITIRFYMLCIIDISWQGFYLRWYGAPVDINVDKKTL